MPSTHPDDQTLKAYGLGKLDDGPASTVNDHLEICGECREKLSGLTSDSFLGKFRDARQPTARSVLGGSLADGTVSFLQAKATASPPSTDTLPPGLANHPDYEIKRELGRGGMGVVYLAHNTMMGRDEVLKVMGRHIMERPGVLERFQREIRAVAKLRHPNIVAAYHAFRIEGGLVFSMEYVEGLDLARLVKAKGPLSVSHAAYFIHQAALGLQHAHEKGLIHRDIKPHNLMLTHDGKARLVKVLDFGLAKATREEKIDGGLTSEGQALGTPDYIAPEQITNAIDVDIRADIYSLGGTMFYLLTGRPPFQANSLYDVYQAHMSRDLEPLNLIRPEVPAELAALVSKMMAKEPRRRFQTPAEISQALTPYFKKGSIAPTSPRADASPPAPTSPVRPDSGSPSILDRLGIEARRSVLEPRKSAQPNSPELAQGSGFPLADKTPRSNRPTWLVRSLVGLASLFFLFTLAVVVYVNYDKGRVKIVIDGPQANVILVDGEKIRNEGRDTTIRLRSGPHQVKVSWSDGHDELRTVVVVRGEMREQPFVHLPKTAPEKPTVVEKPPASAEARWVSLFNGKDLTGWKVDSGDESAWQAIDGELVAQGNDKIPQRYLLSDREFSNFRLRFQYQRRTDDAQSGVALRALFHEMERDSNPENVGNYPFHLTEIMTDFKPKYHAGTLWWSPNVSIQEPLPPDNQAQLKPVGEWNDMVVEMSGQLLRVFINGYEVQDTPLNKHRPAKFPAVGLSRFSGRIGFLIWKSEVRFRRIEIQELGRPPVNGATSFPPAKYVTNSLGMKFALIDSGMLDMGSPESDKDAEPDEKPVHRVRISKSFYLGTTEVTRAQFRKFAEEKPYLTQAEGNPPGSWGWNEATQKYQGVPGLNWKNPGFDQDDDHPVVNVSYNDAKAFAAWLSQKEGKSYRLPTEAEWEYSCRAWSTSRYSFGDDPEGLAAVGNVCDGTAKEKHPNWAESIAARDDHVFTAPVASFRPNKFGLYDMHGNAWEWCSDGYDADYYKHSPVDNPTGLESSPNRVHRGGGWLDVPSNFRSGNRHGGSPNSRSAHLGFRLALDLPGTTSGSPVTVVSNSGRSPASHLAAVEPKSPEPAPPAQPKPTPPDPPKAPEVKIELKPVGGGGCKFLMGSREDNFDSYDNEKPQHEVWLNPYFLGQTEVTQQQYTAVMGHNPSSFTPTGRLGNRVQVNSTDDYPVENVSFYDAIKFCNALSKRHGRAPYYKITNENDEHPVIEIIDPKGMGYRLPTEAEWEFVCGTGARSKYAFGNDPDQAVHYAWVFDNAEFMTHPVGGKTANAWGFYDMHGNVMEWCWDRFGAYGPGLLENPRGPQGETRRRVVRGGSFRIESVHCRPTIRSSEAPGEKNERMGFRVASNR